MISLIFAIDKNNLMGKGNDLPWHYPEDLRYFRERTLGKTVVMGDRTFLSIFGRTGKLLPGRKSIVATLDKSFHHEGVTVINDLISFLKENEYTEEEIFVIGGRQIYLLSLPYASYLYITHINKVYQGDIYFPLIDYDKYDIISRRTVGDLDFVVYRRK